MPWKRKQRVYAVYTSERGKNRYRASQSCHEISANKKDLLCRPQKAVSRSIYFGRAYLASRHFAAYFALLMLFGKRTRKTRKIFDLAKF